MIQGYNKNHCWQYDIKLKNYQKDLEESNLTHKEAQNLKVKDFYFDVVDKDDKKQCQEIKEFINRHEWLGKMPIWITNRFVARLKKNDKLAGAIVMTTPNMFSGILGEENKNLEKLIARGATISWTPTNLGSWLIMNSIKWMVKNTPYRAFTAYSDTEAKELGTIYQACNFFYIGKKYGDKYQYFDPDKPERGWFSSNGFDDRSQIKRYAKQLGIEWKEDWYKRVGKRGQIRKVNWKNIPEDVKDKIREERRKHKERCYKKKVPPKHKYVYILGKDRDETKQLIQKFKNLNNIYPYPKKRGE